jgi:hypothetical protein
MRMIVTTTQTSASTWEDPCWQGSSSHSSGARTRCGATGAPVRSVIDTNCLAVAADVTPRTVVTAEAEFMSPTLQDSPYHAVWQHLWYLVCVREAGSGLYIPSQPHCCCVSKWLAASLDTNT